MSISTRDLDPAFQGAGQKAGIEIWRIENFNPVLVSSSSHGKFFTGDSYIILKTTVRKSGALCYDIHYWLGKDTSQDEAGTAAIKTVELDTALGGRAVQYREVQGHETEKFLSYFKPCIIPLEGGVATGFKHAEAEEHQTRLYVCKGKYVVHVKEMPFARTSLNHDDVFILDTKNKIFQFNGSNSAIQERAKALEVVQYIKDTYHDGKCDIATIEDGKLMADADTGEFWAIFGGFAPLPRKSYNSASAKADVDAYKLFRVEKGETVAVEADSLTRELLDSNQCFILDCGMEVFVWVGKNTSLEERKTLSSVVDEFLRSIDRSNCHIIRVIEGSETVMFRSKFDSWPESTKAAASEGGRGKVAELLKRQGVNVKGLVKSEPPKEEDPQPHIDCTGDLQVWRVDGQQKTLLQASDQSKFYSGDCYIFQYSYPGEGREEYLIGTWFGKQSVEEDRVGATSQASKMVETMKFFPAQAHIHEGSEPIQFFAIFQSFIILKGGLSEGYKNYIAEKELPDDTYTEDGLALFRVQGSGPENMQAIQVEPVASSLNSAYCYILHSGSSIFTWAGNFTTPEDQELVERQLDIIKPEMQFRFQKEGVESEQFWELLGGKVEYQNQKIAREAESDPHLFACSPSNGDLKVTEVYNFNQDDLMTEDIYILDCHSNIFVWIGQQVESKNKMNALNLGKKFLERDFLHEKISLQAPIYVITEGNEPAFFTRFFTWDSKKSAMHGNSFQRKLSLLKNGGTAFMDKPHDSTTYLKQVSDSKDKQGNGKFVVIHLRFDKDMAAHSACDFGGGKAENLALAKYRQVIWQGRVLNSQFTDEELRGQGRCPLTPEEVGLLLASLGFDNTTRLYLASHKVYGGEARISTLRSLFPLMEDKKSLASSEERALIKGKASLLAALDYYVSMHSDIFISASPGNMHNAVVGHRTYENKKTIRPNMALLGQLFLNKNLSWPEFQEAVVDGHKSRQGALRLRKPQQSIYTYPAPDCVCRG